MLSNAALPFHNIINIDFPQDSIKLLKRNFKQDHFQPTLKREVEMLRKTVKSR